MDWLAPFHDFVAMGISIQEISARIVEMLLSVDTMLSWDSLCQSGVEMRRKLPHGDMLFL